MKANKAKSRFVYPDKLYARTNDNITLDISYAPQTMEAVEYVRTDAIIEKALKWYCLDCECNDNCNALHNCFFKSEFKRYLEGAGNALPPKFENALNPDGSTSDNYRYRHFIGVMKDKFIEKAVSWLKENADKCITIKDGTIQLGIGFYINFKRAMKGE